MSIFFQADLTIPWCQKVYVTDAAPSGFGAVVTEADDDEIREAAKWSESQGWAIRAEQIHSRIEDHQTRVGEPELDRPSSSMYWDTGRRGFLELFSGAAILARCIAATTLSWTEDWDILKGTKFDLLRKTNLGRLMRRIRSLEFWWVHMGPPCATFSKARLPQLRSKNILGVSRCYHHSCYKK